IGSDGKGAPTIEPCGVCEHCVGIAEDRHMDVVEMDAASHNGVDDIRDLTDGARYRPVKALLEVYRLDEGHMLAKPACNAFLKTLEEPPGLFFYDSATTEIRKVPITVLSRCQRFDLRRVDQAVLAKHLAAVAEQEGRKVDAAAALLLARAANGSVRDGLSLLDRALAHVEGEVGEADTRALLGLADRTQVFDLFEALMKGDAASALAQLGEAYRAGADPGVVVQDLLDVTHWLTRLKVAPNIADDPTVPEAERARGRTLAGKLTTATLARAWQMLLKGLGEIQEAPSPLAAAEMVAFRLAYAAEMPTPAEIIAGLGSTPAGLAPAPGNGSGPAARGASGPGGSTSAVSSGSVRASAGGSQAQALRSDPAPVPEAAAPVPAGGRPDPQRFPHVLTLFEAKREGILHAHLINNVHLIRFEPGRIEYHPEPHAPRDLPARMMELLQRWTGRRWVVVINAAEEGAPTLSPQAHHAREAQKAAAATHPLVEEVLKAFPGATIEVVRGVAVPPPTSTAIEDEAPMPDDTEEPS